MKVIQEEKELFVQRNLQSEQIYRVENKGLKLGKDEKRQTSSVDFFILFMC